MAEEIIRKGPWTEKEDYQLVFFVGMFGERRWDFIAKVSGLNRTGKSCRLRWVNYLHPGLKRGKLTPQEECLVLELQSKWGNRWSRIAHKLPGRTDNEIKNFWRTHMRKKAQEKKRDLSPSSSSSSSLNCCSSLSNNPIPDALLSFPDNGSESFHETGAQMTSLAKKNIRGDELCVEGYSMDDIWKDIELLTEKENIRPAFEVYGEEGYNFVCPAMASPTWEWNSEMIWRTDEDDKNGWSSSIIILEQEQMYRPYGQAELVLNRFYQ